MFTTCHVCNVNQVRHQCERCKLVAYCSSNCQIADWSAHKLACSSTISTSLLNSWVIGPKHGNESEDSDDEKKKSDLPPFTIIKRKTKEEQDILRNKPKRGRPLEVWGPDNDFADESWFLDRRKEDKGKRRVSPKEEKSSSSDEKSTRHRKRSISASKDDSQREVDNSPREEAEEPPNPSQKRKVVLILDSDEEMQNRELDAVEKRKQKRHRILDADDLNNATTFEEKQEIALQLHVYQLRQWASHAPAERFAFLDHIRHDLLSKSPYINPNFVHFALAMQEIMIEHHRGQPVANCLKLRACLWYNMKPEELQYHNLLTTVPLMPMHPMGRHYIEILHWMELETHWRQKNHIHSIEQHTLDAHQFYLTKNPHIVWKLFGKEEAEVPSSDESSMDWNWDEHQAQEIPDDNTSLLFDGQDFHDNIFLPWFREMQELLVSSPSLVRLQDLMVTGEIDDTPYNPDNAMNGFTNPVTHLDGLSRVSRWLLESFHENVRLNFTTSVFAYSTTTVNVNQFSSGTVATKQVLINRKALGKILESELVFNPKGESLEPYDKETITSLTEPSILLGGYFSWLNIHQDPLHILTMRHDLQLRHYHEKHVINMRPWLLLYTMQGDLQTHNVFSNDVQPIQILKDQLHGGLLVAATIAVLSSNIVLWNLVRVQTLEIDKSRGSLLALALSRGSIGLLNEWTRSFDFVAGLAHLESLISRMHPHLFGHSNNNLNQILQTEKGHYALGSYHFLHHFAIVFQQPSIIRWLRDNNFTIFTWDLLLPIQMLVTQATMLQYDVDISVKDQLKKLDEKGFQINDFKTAVAVKRWQDHIQVNVVEQMDVHYQQETESQMLEIILNQCQDPYKIYHQHLTMNYLLWLYYLDQYYDEHGDTAHIGPKGNMHWHTIVKYLMDKGVLKLDPHRVIRSSELAVSNIERPTLNGFVDYPFIFSRVDFPDTLSDNSMDVDELNPDDFTRNSQGQRVYKPSKKDSSSSSSSQSSQQRSPSREKDSRGSQEQQQRSPSKEKQPQQQWPLPERMCIHPFDGDAITMLNFLHNHVPVHNFEFVLNRIANILDTYRIHLFEPKKLAFSDYFAYHDSQQPFLASGPVVFNELVPHVTLDDVLGERLYPTPPQRFASDGPMANMVIQQETPFEDWILGTINLQTRIEFVQLLTRLACFLRIEESEQYRFAYFITATNSVHVPRISVQWYMNTPLHALLDSLENWCRSHRHVMAMAQVRKLLTIIEDTRYEVFAKSNTKKLKPFILQISDDSDEDTKCLIGNPNDTMGPTSGPKSEPKSGLLQQEARKQEARKQETRKQETRKQETRKQETRKQNGPEKAKTIAYFEQVHGQTLQPLVGFFFSLDRPLLAYHIPMEVANHEEEDRNRVQKRYRQIIIGKNTPGYRNYHIQIPMTARDTAHYPITPRANVRVPSRRIWNEILRRWRVSLHQWDPSPSSGSKDPEDKRPSDSSSTSSADESRFEQEVLKYEQLMYEIQKEERHQLRQGHQPQGMTLSLPETNQDKQAFLLNIEEALNHLSISASLEYEEERLKDMETMVDNLVDSS